MTDKTETPTLVKVTLDKEHTHAGTKHKAGAEIYVDKPDADWLAANGIGKAGKVAASPKA